MSAPIRIFDEDNFTPYQRPDGFWAVWSWEQNRDVSVLKPKMRDDEKLVRKFAHWMNEDGKK